MTVQEVIQALGAEVIVEGNSQREVISGYTCDLLSEVIAKAVPGTAWATIQTHVNIVAVAAMVGAAVVVICEGRKCEPDAVEHAVKENLTILSSRDSAYTVSGKLYALGLR